MQSTIQPSDPTPSPAEFLAGYLHRIHVAQSDALAILQRVMIQAARLLEEQPLEKPYQTRSTNERMRIAMRSAATIINMRLPRLPGEPPNPPSPAQRERVAKASRGRVRVPCSSPSTPANTIRTAAAAAPAPINALSPTPSLSTEDPAHKTPLPPLPSSVPPVPLLDKNPPPPPPDLTFEEKANIYMRQQGIKAPFNAKIADKLRAWHLYTEKYGVKPPFNYTVESLLPPPRPKRKRRVPTSNPRPLASHDEQDRAPPGKSGDAVPGEPPHPPPSRPDCLARRTDHLRVADRWREGNGGSVPRLQEDREDKGSAVPRPRLSQLVCWRAGQSATQEAAPPLFAEATASTAP